LKGLTQEEIEGIEEEQVQELHREAKAEAERRNPGVQKGVLAYKTLQLMEEKWEDESE